MTLPSRWLSVILLAIVCHSLYLYAHFPTPELYRPAADEGTFFHQATTLVDRGPSGFRVLAQEFLTRPELQVLPPPFRLGHLMLAAGALSMSRSFRALSMLSLVAHGLLGLAVFLFVRRWAGEVPAGCAALLVAMSPLGSALATRALSDADYGLVATVSALACVEWAVTGRRASGAWFLVALTCAAVVKEMTLILLPGLAAAIAIGSWRRHGRVDWRPLALVALVPVVLTLVYMAVFGTGTAVSLVKVTLRVNTFDHNPYLRLYHAGPWFTYFIDSLLLAPWATLAFLLLCGWSLARGSTGGAPAILLVLLAGGIAVFGWMPQNARYASPLDALTRVFIGLMIPAAAAAVESPARRRAAIAVAMAVLVVADVAAFQRVFVDNAVYDPVATNLLAARHVIPYGPVRTTLTADEYVDQGLAYYRVGDYQATIGMSQRALALKGDMAEAYNNLGAAYCELGRWHEAVPALQAALRLKPNLAIAANNLRWAESEIGRTSSPR